MLTVEDMATPNVAQWDTVIQGMRLPLKSGHLHDSGFCYGDTDYSKRFYNDLCDNCPYYEKYNIGSVEYGDYDSRCNYTDGNDGFPEYILGENDLKLALRLIKAGSSDRKFLRQLPIVMTITADQVFWRQCDQYKIGTVTNSSSQMHKLIDTRYSLNDFNIPDLDKHTPDVVNTVKNYIEQINLIIKESGHRKDNGDPDWKRDWDFALSLVPQSVYYTKCWSLNYETAINIGLQREGHKNGAWDILIDYWKENLPYYDQFLEAAKWKQKEFKRLKVENEQLWDTVNALMLEKEIESDE